MIKKDLLQLIQANVNNTQPSERWAMYRLIAPIVDFANLESNYCVYFELQQTSAHKTNQAVDIALLKNKKPIVMIEAKRVGRKISAEQISKYLEAEARGIVTNGLHWILSLNNKCKVISILEVDTKVVSESSIDEIVSFIQCKSSASADWTFGNQYVNSSIKPAKYLKSTTGIRKSNISHIALDTTSMRDFISPLDTLSQRDRVLIEAIIKQFDENGGIPEHLCAEVRCSRIVFVDHRIKSGSKRAARIELGREQPDVLLLTAVANRNEELSNLARTETHDKGPHMRRFRLSDDAQATSFGRQLAISLSADVNKVAA